MKLYNAERLHNGIGNLKPKQVDELTQIKH
jgi:hypothetical protein